MSEVFFLRSEARSRSDLLNIPDLFSDLEQAFHKSKSLTDLDEVTRMVNEWIKTKSQTIEERNYLKRLRQKIYDRKRAFKAETIPIYTQPILQETILKQPDHIKEDPKMIKLQNMPIAREDSTEMITTHQASDFLAGVKKAFLNLDGEAFAKNAPRVLAVCLATILVTIFVWLQSVELYKSAGFSNPELTAAGALLMVIGFAAYHSLKRSFLALLLCLYAGGYEGYFMISGTVHDEKVAQMIKVDANPELIFQKEKLQQDYDSYISLKNRYEDLKSDVYQNSWFKKKHLDPAWAEVEKSQSSLSKVKATITAELKGNDVTWMKVFYRLGLVLLCMVMVHQVVRIRKV